MISELLLLFGSAFLAATVFPAQSELVLAHLLLNSPHPPLLLFAIATAGNTLGACVNWLIGRFLLRYSQSRRWNITPQKLAQASTLYRRFGIWTLLFSWLPIIGDVLTIVAGLFKTRFWLFLILVATGKAARYAAILWLVG